MKKVFNILIALMVLVGAYDLYAIEQFSRVKVWGREVLTKDDLNAEFDAIINALNTKFLNGTTTFTIIAGDSILVQGRATIDTLRVRTVFLLEGDIVPDADGLYNIGTSTARIDTLFAQDGNFYKVAVDTLDPATNLIVLADTLDVGSPPTDRFSSTESGKMGIHGAKDGQFIALTLRNSQAQDAGTNESTRLDLTWADGGGNTANGSAIVAGKLGDYSAGATADSYLSFYTSNNNNLVERVNIDDDGYVTIDVDGTMNSGDHHLEIRNGASFSEIDAGETTFANSSTRTIKENFVTITADDIRDDFMKLKVQRYNFKPAAYLNIGRIDSAFADTIKAKKLGLERSDIARLKAKALEIQNNEHARANKAAQKKRVSVMAEDFYPISAKFRPTEADSGKIYGDDQIAALILMVQSLQNQVDSLKALH